MTSLASLLSSVIFFYVKIGATLLLTLSFSLALYYSVGPLEYLIKRRGRS